MGRVEGKVAFITGAARGQGRSHAVRLAEEGADIIAVDICASTLSTPTYELATPEDLERTVAVVEALGRRIIARQADVRDLSALTAVLDEAVGTLGRLDIVVANAGIGASVHTIEDLPERDWHEILDVNLTGAFLTCKAAIPHVIATGDGGAVVIIGSGAALKGVPNVGHYVAAKHAIVGLGRSLANELAPHSIRVNTVHPGNCNTDMIMNPTIYRLFCPDVADPGVDDLARASQALNALPVPWVEARDVSNAVLWLASDEARYVTGVSLPVDAGWSNKW